MTDINSKITQINQPNIISNSDFQIRNLYIGSLNLTDVESESVFTEMNRLCKEVDWYLNNPN